MIYEKYRSSINLMRLTFKQLELRPLLMLNRMYVTAFEGIRAYWGALLTGFLIVFIVAALGDWLFGWGITGFFLTTKEVLSKTIWDVIDLLLIPCTIIAGLLWFSRVRDQRIQAGARVQQQQALEIAERAQNQHYALSQAAAEEQRLQDYFDTISSLLLDRGLRRARPSSEVQSIAQARTRLVVSELSTLRRGQALRFLYEVGLIQIDTPVVSLQGMNFDRVDLYGVVLREANLQGVSLRDADLQVADLTKANLAGANLTGVKLQGADLEGATYDHETIWPGGFNPNAA